jgi:hypothetical protein
LRIVGRQANVAQKMIVKLRQKAAIAAAGGCLGKGGAQALDQASRCAKE